jgi:polyferredoxin
VFEEIKNIKSGIGELRKFGITVGIVLTLLGILFLWRGRDYYPYFFIIAVAFIFLGAAFPILLKPIQKAWMALAITIGFFVTRAILSILFYLVVTPIGLLAKLFGKDFLHTHFDKNINSYWIPKEKAEFDKARYEKQF